MRSSVSLKVVTVLAIVLAMAAVALLVVYDGLSRVGREMRQLAEIGEPSYSATNKVEINLNGMAHAVFAYLRNPEAQYRTKLKEDEADVLAFHARYLELAATDAERNLGNRLGTMFQEFRSLGDSLVHRRGRQDAALTRVAGDLSVPTPPSTASFISLPTISRPPPNWRRSATSNPSSRRSHSGWPITSGRTFRGSRAPSPSTRRSFAPPSCG